MPVETSKPDAVRESVQQSRLEEIARAKSEMAKSEMDAKESQEEIVKQDLAKATLADGSIEAGSETKDLKNTSARVQKMQDLKKDGDKSEIKATIESSSNAETENKEGEAVSQAKLVSEPKGVSDVAKDDMDKLVGEIKAVSLNPSAKSPKLHQSGTPSTADTLHNARVTISVKLEAQAQTFQPLSLPINPDRSPPLRAPSNFAIRRRSTRKGMVTAILHQGTDFVHLPRTDGKVYAGVSLDDQLLVAMSGWAPVNLPVQDDRLEQVRSPSAVVAVFRLCQELRHQIPEDGWDRGEPGRFFASHAETQIMATVIKRIRESGNVNQSFIVHVDQQPCDHCSLFRKKVWQELRIFFHFVYWDEVKKEYSEHKYEENRLYTVITEKRVRRPVPAFQAKEAVEVR